MRLGHTLLLAGVPIPNPRTFTYGLDLANEPLVHPSACKQDEVVTFYLSVEDAKGRGGVN